VVKKGLFRKRILSVLGKGEGSFFPKKEIGARLRIVVEREGRRKRLVQRL